MDLWEMLGVSRESGIGLLAAAIVLLLVVAGRLVRRSRRQERVFVDLSRRD